MLITYKFKNSPPNRFFFPDATFDAELLDDIVIENQSKYDLIFVTIPTAEGDKIPFRSNLVERLFLPSEGWTRGVYENSIREIVFHMDSRIMELIKI